MDSGAEAVETDEGIVRGLTCAVTPDEPNFDQPAHTGYRRLDFGKINETLQQLRARIHERFPGSGLSKVADELLDIAKESATRSAWISRPLFPLRAAIWVLIATFVFVIGELFSQLHLSMKVTQISEFVQALDASVNLVVFFGAAVFSLMTWETRIKRSRALKSVHELRAIVHIVDMHQLPKDPEIVTGGSPTTFLTRRSMNRFELTRYLDYCSELLSLTSKIAALYVQNFNDAVVLSAVDQVEDLSNGISRKIWQKITIIDQLKG